MISILGATDGVGLRAEKAEADGAEEEGLGWVTDVHGSRVGAFGETVERGGGLLGV